MVTSGRTGPIHRGGICASIRGMNWRTIAPIYTTANQNGSSSLSSDIHLCNYFGRLALPEHCGRFKRHTALRAQRTPKCYVFTGLDFFDTLEQRGKLIGCIGRRPPSSQRRFFPDNGILMADSYLSLAERVIGTRRRPMSAQEILADAREYDLLPPHLAGETMEKTLQARIAEDIVAKRSRSRFYRTSIGKYFLRRLSEDGVLPKNARSAFEALPRRRPPPKGRILCIKAEQEDGEHLVPFSNEEVINSFQNSYFFSGKSSLAT